MASDEYELVSKKDIEKLQGGLKNVKDETGSGRGNHAIMESLHRDIIELLNIFKEASKEMKESEGEEELNRQMGELSTKLDIIVEQNEKIAEALITVADMMKGESPHSDFHDREPEPAPEMPSPDERLIPDEGPAAPAGPPNAPPGYPPGPPPGPGAPPPPPPPPGATRRRAFPDFFK
jgi:hypothetical protein